MEQIVKFQISDMRRRNAKEEEETEPDTFPRYFLPKFSNSSAKPPPWRVIIFHSRYRALSRDVLFALSRRASEKSQMIINFTNRPRIVSDKKGMVRT